MISFLRPVYHHAYISPNQINQALFIIVAWKLLYIICVSFHIYRQPPPMFIFSSLHPSNLKPINRTLQHLYPPRHKIRLISLRHRHQARRIRIPRQRMRIHAIRALDLKRVQHADKHKIQLPICQQRASTHTVPHAVSEHRRIGLLEPALGAEDGGIAPHSGIHVTGPCVEEIDCLGGDDNAVVGYVFDGDTGEGETEDGEVAGGC